MPSTFSIEPFNRCWPLLLGAVKKTSFLVSFRRATFKIFIWTDSDAKFRLIKSNFIQNSKTSLGQSNCVYQAPLQRETDCYKKKKGIDARDVWRREAFQ